MLLKGLGLGPPHPLPRFLGWELTMPSSTQKPSCSRTCGRRMMAVVTGGQWTMLRVTSVCDFTSCARWGLVGLAGPSRRGRGWCAARLLVKLQPPGPQLIHS